MTRLAFALLAAALPLLTLAQDQATSTPTPTSTSTATPTATRVEDLPLPSGERAGVRGTVSGASPTAPAAPLFALDLGGTLTLTAAYAIGALDDHHLATYALPPDTARTFGLTIGQSRLHLGVTAPGDKLLAGAALSGRVEVDFAGGLASADGAQPLLRLREAWLAARWDRALSVSLLVGQADGLVGGPTEPISLAHVAIPRFAGAGYLYRRAPQVQAGLSWGGDLTLSGAAAVLAPLDRTTAPVPSATNPTGVGERSGLPDLEGRLALTWQPGGKPVLTAGLSGHAGRETYLLAGGTDASLDTFAAALDLTLDLPWCRLAGAGWTGKNLDVLHTATLGATASLSTTGGLVAMTGVAVSGGWAQLSTTLGGVTLFGGAGVEVADRADLPFNPPEATVVLEALQGSGGASLTLATGWSAGLEYTVYRTTFIGASDRQVTSSQVELATRYVF